MMCTHLKGMSSVSAVSAAFEVVIAFDFFQVCVLSSGHWCIEPCHEQPHAQLSSSMHLYVKAETTVGNESFAC